MPSPALERTYASNQQRIVSALAFQHSALPNGSLRFVLGRQQETLGGDSYEPAAITISRPSKNTSGSQQLTISISNTDNQPYRYLLDIISANRTAEERISVTFTEYLADDLNTPANEITGLFVNSANINTESINLSCVYTPLPNNVYPSKRYFADIYPGVKYSNR